MEHTHTAHRYALRSRSPKEQTNGNARSQTQNHVIPSVSRVYREKIRRIYSSDSFRDSTLQITNTIERKRCRAQNNEHEVKIQEDARDSAQTPVLAAHVTVQQLSVISILWMHTLTPAASSDPEHRHRQPDRPNTQKERPNRHGWQGQSAHGIEPTPWLLLYSIVLTPPVLTTHALPTPQPVVATRRRNARI